MELGTIHSLSLKELWAGEATNFTPWLAENLELLSNKLGMDLELERTEASAGDFYADIIAKNLSTNQYVLIENQYGQTDHKHLGQLITYASVLDAADVVWIAEKIRPEHKSAIDFLNQNLKQSLRIYAIEASAIRIDESKPAFILNVISKPNEAAIPEPESISQPSETHERYRAFFQELIDDLRESHKFTNARVGQPQNWYSFASANSKVYKYSATFSRGSHVRAEIYIDSSNKQLNEQLFDCLHAKKQLIESAIGVPLEWERLEDARACRIAVYRDGDIHADTETLTSIKNWIIAHLIKFKKIFPTYIDECLENISI